MNELNKLTNVIGKLDKLVHKQNCSHDFFLYFINYNIIIVQVIYINIETKEVVRIGYNGFLFRHEYSGDGLGATHLRFHLNTLVDSLKNCKESTVGVYSLLPS